MDGPKVDQLSNAFSSLVKGESLPSNVLQKTSYVGDMISRVGRAAVGVEAVQAVGNTLEPREESRKSEFAFKIFMGASQVAFPATFRYLQDRQHYKENPNQGVDEFSSNASELSIKDQLKEVGLAVGFDISTLVAWGAASVSSDVLRAASQFVSPDQILYGGLLARSILSNIAFSVPRLKYELKARMT